MSNQTRFHFCAVDGVIELEGSEEFVTRQIQDLKELISQLSALSQHVPEVHPVQIRPTENNDPALPPAISSVQPAQKSAAGIEDYPHTFEEINGSLKVVASIPGDSIKAKMKNSALIYTFGASLQGRHIVSTDEIRQVCQDHGCLDSPNFSKVFNEKTLFVLEGPKGGKKSVKLTYSGIKSAKALVENIESNAN